MARGHLIVVLWLGVAAASPKSAASERLAGASYLHGLHLLEETSSKCERATGMRVLCPAKRDRMWAAALKDACAVHNDGGEAYNHTCTYPS